MEPSSSHDMRPATATEHGYCPDDAHEPLEEHFVDTPVFDVDTEYIRIGPCILHWQCAGGVQLGILRALQREQHLQLKQEELTYDGYAKKCGFRTSIHLWSG